MTRAEWIFKNEQFFESYYFKEFPFLKVLENFPPELIFLVDFYKTKTKLNKINVSLQSDYDTLFEFWLAESRISLDLVENNKDDLKSNPIKVLELAYDKTKDQAHLVSEAVSDSFNFLKDNFFVALIIIGLVVVIPYLKK